MRMAGEALVRKLTGIIVFIVCIPLIGSILIKPDKRMRKQEKDDTSVINERFEIAVREDVGVFYYKPENLTGLMMYRVIPKDAVFSGSEDYIVRTDVVYDPEQEYLKALAIVCRSCIVSTWETEQRPDVLDYSAIQLGADDFYKIIQTDAVYAGVLSEDTTQANDILLSFDGRRIKLDEIEQAVDATKGAVLTGDGKVITAPFFTTSPSDMLVLEAGDGVGFSLNYAFELAAQGMNFHEILKCFFDDFRVTIYE